VPLRRVTGLRWLAAHAAAACVRAAQVEEYDVGTEELLGEAVRVSTWAARGDVKVKAQRR